MKYVLLTGASGGLGLNLSKYLLDKGYFIVMLYHTNKDNVEILHNEYPNSMIYQVNLCNDNEIDQLNNYLKDNNIKIDILINNAAIDHNSDIENKNKETFMNIFELNTYVPFKLMETFKEATVVNISSDNTIDKYDEVSLEYDVSKAGLNMLSKIFRKKYPTRIINTIAFGWLDTSMNDITDDIKQYIEFVPFDKACESIEKLFDKQEDDIVIVRK